MLSASWENLQHFKGWFRVTWSRLNYKLYYKGRRVYVAIIGFVKSTELGSQYLLWPLLFVKKNLGLTHLCFSTFCLLVFEKLSSELCCCLNKKIWDLAPGKLGAQRDFWQLQCFGEQRWAIRWRTHKKKSSVSVSFEWRYTVIMYLVYKTFVHLHRQWFRYWTKFKFCINHFASKNKHKIANQFHHRFISCSTV